MTSIHQGLEPLSAQSPHLRFVLRCKQINLPHGRNTYATPPFNPLRILLKSVNNNSVQYFGMTIPSVFFNCCRAKYHLRSDNTSVMGLSWVSMVEMRVCVCDTLSDWSSSRSSVLHRSQWKDLVTIFNNLLASKAVYLKWLNTHHWAASLSVAAWTEVYLALQSSVHLLLHLLLHDVQSWKIQSREWTRETHLYFTTSTKCL